MARLDASPTAGDSRPSRQPAVTQQDNPGQGHSKGWPFAEGSQNHLDETSAPWPRPAPKPASGVPVKRVAPK